MGFYDLGCNPTTARCRLLDRELAVELSELFFWRQIQKHIRAAGADFAGFKRCLNLRFGPTGDTRQPFLLTCANHWSTPGNSRQDVPVQVCSVLAWCHRLDTTILRAQVYRHVTTPTR